MPKLCHKIYQNRPNHTKTVIFYGKIIELQFTNKTVSYSPIDFLGSNDSNSCPPAPKAGALTGLANAAILIPDHSDSHRPGVLPWGAAQSGLRPDRRAESSVMHAILYRSAFYYILKESLDLSSPSLFIISLVIVIIFIVIRTRK